MVLYMHLLHLWASLAVGKAVHQGQEEEDEIKQNLLSPCAVVLVQLIGAQKGDTLWSADLEQASQGSHKLLLPSNDVITVLSYTPG